MPKGVYQSDKRLAHLRAYASQAASAGGKATARKRKQQARARWSVAVAQATDKWEVWSLAMRVGYKMGANTGERRGFAAGYEQALQDTQRAAS